MSDEQTIMYPQVCLGCKSRLMSAMDGEAVYECGTKITLNYRTKNLIAVRSQKCLEGAPQIDGE